MARTLGRVGVVAAATLTLLVPAGQAGAASATVTTVAFTFVAPLVTVPIGGTLDLRNSDIVPHNLVSVTPGLFASPTVARGQTAAVAGVSDLPAGDYAFFCNIHPFMRGSLTVSATGGGGLPSLPLTPGSLPLVGVTATPTSLTVFEGAVYTASLVQGTVSKQTILPSGLLAPALPYASGFTNPLGVAFAPDGTLFVADSRPSTTPGRTTAGRVWAIPRGGGAAAAVGQVVVDELPNGRHNTNGMAVHGDRLYITNGNSTDDGVDGGSPSSRSAARCCRCRSTPAACRHRPPATCGWWPPACATTTTSPSGREPTRPGSP